MKILNYLMKKRWASDSFGNFRKFYLNTAFEKLSRNNIYINSYNESFKKSRKVEMITL